VRKIYQERWGIWKLLETRKGAWGVFEGDDVGIQTQQKAFLSRDYRARDQKHMAMADKQAKI
jgi:hypothetical protein